jgi:DEP domain-containing protein 5
MLVAGYEQHFNESLRYWRTRFIVIPTEVPSATTVMPHGERLDDEEIRISGMDKLAEMFSNARWRVNDRTSADPPPVRFLPTDQDPTACLLDEDLVVQLDQVHAAGPLQRKIQDRYIGELNLAAIAKAMREEGGVPIKEYRWHGRKYPASFTGWEFVSWLCREFKDVPTREEGARWGVKLLDMGLFDHARGLHGFLDGYALFIAPG